jgi:hypothetical protein
MDFLDCAAVPRSAIATGSGTQQPRRGAIIWSIMLHPPADSQRDSPQGDPMAKCMKSPEIRSPRSPQQRVLDTVFRNGMLTISRAVPHISRKPGLNPLAAVIVSCLGLQTVSASVKGHTMTKTTGNHTIFDF